jgi:hypothetical protein
VTRHLAGKLYADKGLKDPLIFFCCKISSLAIPNRRSNEARRCQGYHCAVKAALLEEYDRAEQVMADDFQVNNSIE